MRSEDIRKLRKQFWEDPKRNHKWLPPDKLIPSHWDTTAMFTLAGMQQLVPYLSWKAHPLWTRLYNIQKCLRTNDIDEVGDERHLTLFEMMWNWSLWDYFKKEAIQWSREFLTDYLKIPLEKIGASVFKWEDNIPEDIQSYNLWREQWISEEKIKKLWKEDNFWWPAGEIWPCGPCTEIYVDRGDIWWPADWNIGENDRYIEIWNDVFMEYYKDKDWSYKKLPQQNVDTGMWLERITMIMQQVPTVFETDLFEPIIKVIEKYANKFYPLKEYFWNNLNKNYSKEEILRLNELEDTKRFRIIADHVRASVFLIWDWLIPSNEGRWYVLRRLIRRFFYNLILLNKDFKDIENFVDEIVDVIANKYWDVRPEVRNEKENIKKVLKEEIIKFNKTINRWLKILDEYISKKLWNKVISWDIDSKKVSTILRKFLEENLKSISNLDEVFLYLDWVLWELIDNGIQHGETKYIKWWLDIQDWYLIIGVYDKWLDIFERFQKDNINIQDINQIFEKIFQRWFTTNPERWAGNWLYWTKKIVEAVRWNIIVVSWCWIYELNYNKLEKIEDCIKWTYIELKLPIENISLIPNKMKEEDFDLTDNLDLFE